MQCVALSCTVLHYSAFLEMSFIFFDFFWERALLLQVCVLKIKFHFLGLIYQNDNLWVMIS